MNDSEGTLDPRIQIELENLNTATNDINKLEIDLEVAQNTFKRLFDESTAQYKEFLEKLGYSCIEKARCYYEAIEIARQAQVECDYQAQLYHKANEIHAAAKETVALAELRFTSHKQELEFDQTWQEMLNHATIKVMNAENQKAERRAEHQRKTAIFDEAKQKVQELEEKYQKAIRKARPYFEVLSYWEPILASQKEKTECLQQAVKNAKQTYATSFRALEEISNEIHQQRRDLNKMINGPREPGVGAELINPMEIFNEQKENDIALNKINNSNSNNTDTSIKICQVNFEEDIDNITRSIDGSESTLNQWELELQASMEKLNNSTSFKNKFDIDPHKTDFSNEHLQLNSTSSNYNNKKEDDDKCKLNRIEKDDELNEKSLLSEEVLTSSQHKSSESTDCNIHLPKQSEENTCSMFLNNRSKNIDSDESDIRMESLESSNEFNYCELITHKNATDYDNKKNDFLPQFKHLNLLNLKESRLSNSLDNINTSSLQNFSAKVTTIHKSSNRSDFLKLLRFQSLSSLESLKTKCYSLTNLIGKKNVESLTNDESKVVPIVSSDN